MSTHVSTSPTVRGLESRRASLAPGFYLAIVHVSPAGALGPIGRGVVIPEVLDHVQAIEAELAAARTIPHHAQELADNVRQALGRPSCYHSADVAAALALFDLRLRGAQ